MAVKAILIPFEQTMDLEQIIKELNMGWCYDIVEMSVA